MVLSIQELQTYGIGSLVLGTCTGKGVSTGRKPGCPRLKAFSSLISNRSPGSSLQLRYDQPGSSSLENLPPVAASIEQLLERQWSEGQQFLLEQGTPSDSK